MEDSIEFRRFLEGILQSPIPSEPTVLEGAGEAPEPEPQRRRRVRRSLTSAEEILELLVASRGTHRLVDREIVILRSSDDSQPVIARELRRLLERFSYLDRRLLTLVTDSTPTSLLIPFLLLVLHHRELIQILQMNEALLEKFKLVIGLTVLIDEERIPRDEPEHGTKRVAYREVRSGKNRMLAVVRDIVDRTEYFYTTHQLFFHNLINNYLDQRVDWQKKWINSLAFINPPTQQEIDTYRRLEVTENLISSIDVQIQTLMEEGETLRAAIREASPRDRPLLRADMAEVNQRLGVSRTERRRVNPERNQIHRRLGPRIGLIRQYLLLENRELYNRRAGANRDLLLRELDSLLDTHSSRRLFVGDENQRWIRYRKILEKLIRSEQMVSLEILIDTFLQRYGRINSNRNFGISEHYTGHTYTKHPENAVDIIVGAGVNIFVVAPTEFTIPMRLLEEGQTPLPYIYQQSLVNERVYVSTDIQDVFGKLAFGLLRPRGQSRTGSDKIEEIMRDEGASDLAPEYLSDPREQNFDVSRIIAGLAYRHLTETPNATEFDEIRDNILSDWEVLIIERLRLAEDTVIFDRIDRRADRGHVGVGRLIRHRPIADVLRIGGEILRSPEQSAHDNARREGLVHRIWRLLWQLISAGAMPHRRGQSVAIEHHYESRLARPASKRDSRGILHSLIICEFLYEAGSIRGVRRFVRKGWCNR